MKIHEYIIRAGYLHYTATLSVEIKGLRYTYSNFKLRNFAAATEWLNKKLEECSQSQ
jgi:hypothetical protein